ncbi:uncharacterized protein V6R79_006107 [Siganus canaliculatus]
MVLCSLSSVCFEDQLKFSASRHLSSARSKWFKIPETESQSDTWGIKPPDFSVKLYRSLEPPQKKGRRTHSNKVAPRGGDSKIFLPRVLPERRQRKDAPDFITSHRPPDAVEAEMMFVRTGKYGSGPYRDHKPHDFRPLDEDLPDFVTTYDRDPGNLTLKLKHLDILATSRSESDLILSDRKTKMDTYKPAEPRWDAGLILPLLPWPPKSASYTVSEMLGKYSHDAPHLFNSALNGR